MLRVYNDLPGHQIGDGAVMLELGDLYAGEKRKLLLKLEVPAMAALGLTQVAELELSYVELPGLVGQSVMLPMTVNVVPGDEAAGRVADPVVRTEVLFQEAQDDKKLASEALERGDRDDARRHLDAARSKLERGGRRRARGGAVATSRRSSTTSARSSPAMDVHESTTCRR